MSPETPPRFRFRRLAPLAVLAAACALFVAAGGPLYLSFTTFAAHRDWLAGLSASRPLLASMVFIAGYAGLTALSFPAAELLTFVGGFLFGRWFGTLYAVTAATIGATVAFLAVRAGLAGIVRRAGRVPQRLAAGFNRDALNYLLVLRLVPLFPFWLVNLAAGAAGLRLQTYVAGTFVGIIPAAFMYASLGAALDGVLAEGRHPDFGLLLRPPILLPLLGLAGLAMLPVVSRYWRNAGGSR